MKGTTGTREWSAHSANCFVGCEHSCRYCYAREMAVRFSDARWSKATDLQKYGDVRTLRVTRENWKQPRLDIGAMTKTWRKLKGVIMFPTTSDITPATLDPCRMFLRNILRPGNQVLIVTKPHYEVVDDLCTKLSYWREQIEWRMTITARDPELLAYWEPGAPKYTDRIGALRRALWYGYRTSVAVEPMLDTGDVVEMVNVLTDRAVGVLDSVWIGKMNRVRQRCRIESEEDERQVERIEKGQTDERIMEIVRELAGCPLIRWKDSIQEVIERKEAERCT